MTQRFYLDTAIWRDYLEERSDNIRPLGELAFQFLQKCMEHKCTVLYSEPVLFELKDLPKQRVKEMLSSFEELVIEAPVSQKQFVEAKKLAKERNIPFNDAFHAVIARDNSATMITRDKHFEEILDIVESKTPEEITFD